MSSVWAFITLALDLMQPLIACTVRILSTLFLDHLLLEERRGTQPSVSLLVWLPEGESWGSAVQLEATGVKSWNFSFISRLLEHVNPILPVEFAHSLSCPRLDTDRAMSFIAYDHTLRSSAMVRGQQAWPSSPYTELLEIVLLSV